MKIGDKVRFLNDVGGGVISGFQGRDTVLVEDEDGFDIPVLRSECVVVETDNYNLVTPEEKEYQEVTPQDRLKESMSSPVVETKEGDDLNVFLAFAPQNIKELSTTSFDVFLVNDSNYYLYYTYSNKTNNEEWSARSHDIVPPNTKLYVETFTKLLLNELEHLRVQLISFKHDRNFEMKPPVDVQYKLDTVKFYKLHSFKDNPFFEQPCLLYDIVVRGETKKPLKISAKDLREGILSKPEFQPKTKMVKKTKEKNNIIEVDLHIHEVLDDIRGLSNKEMLECQLARLKEVMDENKNNKGQRIVFVHGKGEGVLRKAVIQELRRSYKSCIYQDASFQEYGFGATMVTIK